MMFKSSLSILAGALLLSTATFAAIDVPEVCPSASALQSVGFVADDLNQLDIGVWYVLTKNTNDYGTDNQWLFAMGLIEGDTQDNAAAASAVMLTTLSGNPEPEAAEGGYVCLYDTEGGFAAAVTGIDFISSMRIMQLVHRK